MFEFLANLFNTSDFPARWHCGNWTSGHGWLHIISDFAIAGAYLTIPIAIGLFAWRRRDVPFQPLFWLFAAFILSCGFGHFAEGVIFWHPWYRFSGLIKACTAIVSWATVLALIPLIPRALALPSLARVNMQMESEIAERKAAEQRLKTSYEDLQEFTRQTLGREDRILALKTEVNELLRQLGQEPRYTLYPAE